MKQMFAWLHRAMLSPLSEASSVKFHADPAEPAARLDHPTYLRRGLSIAGVTPPVSLER